MPVGRYKKPELIGVILLTEYHASSIRQRRVILLRSDIRLTPSDIRYASFKANRISLKPQGFNITFAPAKISLFAKAKNITHRQQKKRESYGILLPHDSLFCFIASFAFVVKLFYRKDELYARYLRHPRLLRQIYRRDMLYFHLCYTSS